MTVRRFASNDDDYTFVRETIARNDVSILLGHGILKIAGIVREVSARGYKERA